MTGREQQSRSERARRCYAEARFEIDFVRNLAYSLELRGKTLAPYLKLEAIASARYLVRLGRKLQYTNERVQLPRDLGMWQEASESHFIRQGPVL